MLIVCPSNCRQAAKTSGVQRLLEAEKEATKIVQKARQCKQGAGQARCRSTTPPTRLISNTVDRIQRAKEAREEAALARGDRLAVGDDVELAALADLDRDLDAELGVDLGGETRRPGLIASSRAVEDAHVHDRSLLGAEV